LVKLSLISVDIAVIITLTARAFLVFQSRRAAIGAGDTLSEIPERELELGSEPEREPDPEPEPDPEVDICYTDIPGYYSISVVISY
jgi:hypothetical protein